MTMQNAAFRAPVEYHLRPVSSHPPGTAFATVRRLVGSAPAPGAGSVMQKALVTSARTRGPR